MRVPVTTVTAKMSGEGKQIMGISASVMMASMEIHTCETIVQVYFSPKLYLNSISFFKIL